jgi:hypothetical protein
MHAWTRDTSRRLLQQFRAKEDGVKPEYPGIVREKADDNYKLLMVDQLWCWVVDDSKSIQYSNAAMCCFQTSACQRLNVLT